MLLAHERHGCPLTYLHPNDMRPLTLRTVLVATDLSDALLPALRTAAELARLTGARLDVVHAATGPGDAAERAVNEQLQAADVASDVPFGLCVERGEPDRVIDDEARRADADVIVLGPHRPDRPYGLGSTAARVVRASQVPCLVLPVALPLPLGSVLAAVDATDAARGTLTVALSWASALRRRPGNGGEPPTRLLALYVAPRADRLEGGSATALLEREVAAVSDRLADIAGVDVEYAAEPGVDPAGAILRRSRAGDFDLVVLGTRREAATDPAQLGSVSAAVVQRATRPILLVPPAIWREYGAELPS